jgi:phytanoyl-CoA hydroxylase
LTSDTGYSLLAPVLDPPSVEVLLERLSYYEATADQHAARLEFEYERRRDGGAPRVRKMRRLPWLELKPWSVIWQNDAVQELLSQRFHEEVRVAFCAAFLKPARVGSRTPYHQDQALWSRQLPGAFSCWIALDDAIATTGCLIMCPGSHLLGMLDHEEPPGGGHPEVRADLLGALSKQAVPVNAGGALVWHRYTVHGSEANAAGRPRRAVVTVFAAARLLDKDDPFAWAP